MRYLRFLIANWFIVLQFCLAAVTIYLIWQTLRSSDRSRTKSRVDGDSERDHVKKFTIIGKSFRIRHPAILALVLFVLVLISVLCSPLIRRWLPSVTPAKDNNETIIRVETGKTGSVFGRDLLITLIRTESEATPPQYKVTASISSPGYSDLRLEKEDVASTKIYDGKVKVEIRILAADAHTATFSVVRKDH